MAVTQERINRAQPLLAGEWRSNVFLASPCGRTVRVRSEKEVSLQALPGLQQVAELLFLWMGWLLQNTYLADGIKLGEEPRDF